MSKKMSNNLFLLKNMRPKTGSKYRNDADKIITMYENGEIANVKTAFNLVSKSLQGLQISFNQTRSNSI